MNGISYGGLAALAENAYVYLDKLVEIGRDYRIAADLEFAITTDENFNGQFAQEQAREFVENWSVVDHRPNTDSDFSSTLFKDKDGRYVLAFRGTEGPLSRDMLTNAGDIIRDGLAIHQIVDMYNEYQRLSSSAGAAYQMAKPRLLEDETQAYQQALFEAQDPYGTGEGANALDFLRARNDIIVDSGKVYAIDPITSTDVYPEGDEWRLASGTLNGETLAAVTGHSLGGHLAMAFSRLFGVEALAINGAGFRFMQDPTSMANTTVNNLFSLLGGASSFAPDKILNIYGDKAPEFVAQNGPVLFQPGGHEPIFIEAAAFPAYGHGIEQMTDALAVMDLITRLVPSLHLLSPSTVFTKFNHLLEGSSNKAASSFDVIVKSLSNLLITDGSLDGVEADNQRELSYVHLAAVKNKIESLPFVDRQLIDIQDFASTSALSDAAASDTAVRYALLNLDPFVIAGDETLYEQHNTDGALSLYDPSTGKGLSTEYMAARAEALVTLAGINMSDAVLLEDESFPTGFGIPFRDAWLETRDATKGTTLRMHPLDVQRPQMLFGAGGNDTLVGGAQADRLFGGDGDDELRGNGGGDYLEGGSGTDTYWAGTGDTIFDHDGDGRIYFDNDLLFGGERTQGETVYVDASGRYRYEWSGEDLKVTRSLDNEALTIKSFDDFDFDITLTELTPAPQPFRPFSSGTADSEHIEGEHEIATSYTDWDSLNIYNKPDHIRGQEGRDWIYAWSRPGEDNDGNLLGNAPDSDIVEGGVGKDFIHGGPGDDVLYATTAADAEAVKDGLGSLVFGGLLGEEGDFVTGESGDDSVYGSGRMDGLFGGDGNDRIYAGGGNDYIYGDWQAYLPAVYLDIVDYDYQWLSIDMEGTVNVAVHYLSGIGDDHIYAGNGDDHAWGEAGDDVIFGGEGNDQLNGDISRTNSDGSATLPASAHGDDRLYGESGEDVLIGNGGNDYLFGGDDNDWLEGDSRVVLPGDLPYHGDDHLQGDAGSDTLIGLGGSDTLYGGTGDDFLYGDASELDIDYHGRDRLYGGDGDDLLVGFGGNDDLFGGTGSDEYEFSPGHGLDSIVDTDGGAFGDSLHFVGAGGIGSVTFSLHSGDLHAKIGEEGVVFHDWDISQFGGVYYYDAERELIGHQTVSDVLALANSAPTVATAASNERFSEDRLVSVSLRDVGFADANGGNLSYSATLSDGGALPDWLHFNADARLLVGVPGNDAVGGHSIRVTAEDGYGGSVSHTVNLQIDNTNDAPELIAPLPSRSVTSGLDFEHDLSGYFRDVDDGDILSVAVSLGNGDPLPVWASFDPDTMMLTGTPPNGFSDVLVIRAVASDNAGAQTGALYKLSFRSAADSLQTSLLTRYDLSVPDSAGYYPFYIDRPFFELQNGLLGDVNGDGYDDYYFGTDTVGHAFWRDRLTEWDGAAIPDSTAVVQIIYGDANGWTAPDLRTTSFTLGSDSIFDALGASGQGAEEALLDAYRLTPLGDPNNDGFDDFTLGDRVFWGNGQGFDATYRWEDLAQRPLLSPADQPDFSGDVVNLLATIGGVQRTLRAKNVGDVNGDGLDDYVTPVDVSTFGSSVDTPSAAPGAPQQKPLDDYQISDADPVEIMHVLYGRVGGLNGEIDLDQLDPGQGYSIGGFTQFVETREHSGTIYDVNSVSYNPLVSGGDIDGDGLNDIAISTLAGFVNSEPVNVYHNDYSVRNYILFGARDPVNGIDLATMSPDQGMTQEYLPNTTTYGQELVPGLIELGGDINGDGFADAVSVTGDYREADYGGRVDLRVLYGSDLRNNALFQGGDESDEVVVQKQGSVYTLGGNDTVLIRPDAGPARFEVDSGSGDDTIDLLIPDNTGLGAGTTAYLNGGSGSDTYRVTGGSALPASGIRLPANNVYINDRSAGGPIAGGNSLVVGLGSPGGGFVSMPQLGFGSLKLSFAELDLAIHLQSFDKDNVLEGPRDIDTFDFGNGRFLTYEELVALGFDLTGTDTADLIEGSSVADRIQGLAGADTLIGGRGDDELTGGAGDDILDGGKGDDRYFFDLGDGTDQISDPDGMDQVEFGEGLEASSLTADRIADDLALSFDSQDTLVLKDWFGGNTRFLEHFVFFDGTRLLAADIEQQLTAPGVVLVGSRRGDDLTGTVGNDELYGGRSSDTLSGLDGDDLIVGGRGRDLLLGGSGDDTFMVSPGDGYDDIWGGDGYDRIVGSAGDDTIGLHRHFSADNGIEEIDGGAGFNVITGSNASNMLDFSATTLWGIAQIHGANGNDTIVGTSENDVIAGGRGRDKLYGGAGNDTYLFSRTHGRDVIQDSGGASDVLSLLDINHDQAWFSRAGDSLEVSVIGTRDSIRIDDWFADPANQLEQVQAADGMFVTPGSIDLLVAAMAAFNPSRSAIADGSVEVSVPLQGEIAAAWQSASGTEALARAM